MENTEKIKETAALLHIGIEEAKSVLGFTLEFKTIKDAERAFLSDGSSDYKKAGWDAWERTIFEKLSEAKTAYEVSKIYQESPYRFSNSLSAKAAQEKQLALSLVEVESAQTLDALKLASNGACGEAKYLLCKKWHKMAESIEDKLYLLGKIDTFLLFEGGRYDRLKEVCRDILPQLISEAKLNNLNPLKQFVGTIIKFDEHYYLQKFLIREIREANTIEQLDRIYASKDINLEDGDEAQTIFREKKDSILLSLLPNIDSAQEISAMFKQLTAATKPAFAKRGIELALKELEKVTHADVAERYFQITISFGYNNEAMALAMKKRMELTENQSQLAEAISDCFAFDVNGTCKIVPDHIIDFGLEKLLAVVTDHDLMFKMHCIKQFGESFRGSMLEKWRQCEIPLKDLEKLYNKHYQIDNADDPKVKAIIEKWEETALALINEAMDITQLKELLHWCYRDGEARKQLIRKVHSM